MPGRRLPERAAFVSAKLEVTMGLLFLSRRSTSDVISTALALQRE